MRMNDDNLARLEALPVGPLDGIELVTVRLPFVSPFGTKLGNGVSFAKRPRMFKTESRA